MLPIQVRDIHGQTCCSGGVPLTGNPGMPLLLSILILRYIQQEQNRKILTGKLRTRGTFKGAIQWMNARSLATDGFGFHVPAPLIFPNMLNMLYVVWHISILFTSFVFPK